MSEKGLSRRGFLRTTAAGALALGALPTIITPRRAEAYQPGAPIHPNMDPLRVVGLHDPSMTTSPAVPPEWAAQDKLVAANAVEQNVHRLAMALAEESSEAKAWEKLIVKPAGKSWSDVVVAIKTNNICHQHTHSPVMATVCHALTDVLGVSPQNVTIYDAKHGGNMSRSTPFEGLPDGVRVADKWGGFSAKTTVPAPYLDGNAERSCLEHLVNGTVDILINIAMCKGHGGQFGGFTLSMKNHFGTFDPKPGHAEGGGADYVIGINKSPEVLGEMDPRTGRVLFPRQQLVLIDALWASGGGGPCARPSDQLNRLMMGTCGPAVDYVVATRVRQEKMGWRINQQVADRFLAEFGFSKEDLPQGGRLIDAAAIA